MSEALAKRATSLEHEGKWEAAGDLYCELFWEGVEQRNLQTMVDALRGQARTYRQRSFYEEAEELAALSFEIAERHTLRQAAARAINTIAWIRYSRDDWGAAERLYEAALERARDIGDDELIALVCQNLGTIANIRGDRREARTLYLESIGSSVRSGNKVNEIMAYNNLGIVCSDMGEWMEADLYLSRGIEIAERAGITPLLAKLYVKRAKPLIMVSELGQARESLDRAEEFGSHARDPVVLSETARQRGVVARLEGRFGDAHVHLARAISIALEHHLELERAEALQELGQLYWQEGNMQDAIATLAGAKEACRSLGAERDVERLEELSAHWESLRAASAAGPGR